MNEFAAPAFYPGLPSGARRGPSGRVPRRKSPVWWDRPAMEAYWERLPKNVGGRAPKGNPGARVWWLDVLLPLRIGESVTVTASAHSARKGASYNGAKLGRKFTVKSRGDQHTITRVG